MARVIIQLDDQERDALLQLARTEKRDPDSQAALIIRADLERRGLLPVNTDARRKTGAVNYATP